MKAIKSLFTFFGLFLILLFILSSCSTSKITALSCPKLPGNRYDKPITDSKWNRNRPLTAHYRVKTRTESVAVHAAGTTKKDQGNKIKSSPQENINNPGLARVNGLTKLEYSKTLTASADNSIIPLATNNMAFIPLYKEVPDSRREGIISIQSVKCDTIVLKSGSVYIGKVEEVDQDVIRYRRCDNLNGPVILVTKSDISLIKYSNGSREVISSAASNTATPVINSGTQREYIGVIGFLLGDLGIVIGGAAGIYGLWLPFGLIAVICGVISLIKLKRHPERYLTVRESKKIGKMAIIIGAIGIVAFIVLVAILSSI
ncbi:MAG: hypothetical protein ABSG89_07240 [Bacteroidales bacterium]|jgi:hypothetical protein